MNWILRMNEAVGFIEAKLDGELDVAEAARIADCSPYHFQRVFGYMAGVTLAEYIRRRRLTLAAFELQRGGVKVIDVALKYGYDSPTSFARAFAALHGLAPSEAKTTGVLLTAYPPISFKITVQGVTAMDYRIETAESFNIAGVKLRTTTENNERYQVIPGAWADAGQDGTIAKLCTLMDRRPMGVLGVSVGDWSASADFDFDYYIAVATTQPAPEGLEAYTVPAGSYAVFECVGPLPGAIPALQKRIVTEWLPTSGYDYGDGPDIEVYGQGEQSAADYRCQVWLPVKKK